MIELRWIWKEQDTGILAGECLSTPEPTLYPMLQYRDVLARDHDGFALVVTEWIDVPLPEKP